MANVIDLSTSDVTINPGDLEGDLPPYLPDPVAVIGVGSNSLTVNDMTMEVRSMSGVAPGANLTVQANSARVAFGSAYEEPGKFQYESSEKLASLSVQLEGAHAGVTLDQSLVDKVAGTTSVTFGDVGYYESQRLHYTPGIEPSIGPVNEIQVYGLGKNGSITTGDFNRTNIGPRTLTYDSEISALKRTYSEQNFAFNIHSISPSDAQLIMEQPNRYIAPDEYENYLKIQMPARGPVCFLRGTLVSTQRGHVAVEELKIGDELPCLKGVRTIKWIGRRSDRPADLRSVDLNQYLPVRIQAGAISHLVPTQDLIVSPGHHLMISGHLVRACDILNGATIFQFAPNELQTIDYFHIELDKFDMIIAHGMYSESWADGGNRNFFHNAGVTALHPQDSQRRRAPRPGFDHLVLREGEVIEAIRLRLKIRAEYLAKTKPSMTKAA